MLVRLLEQVARAKGAVTQAGLARQMGVSEALLAPMIDELARLGYLAEVEPGCGTGQCSRCSLGGSCAAQPQARLWALTERGRRLVGAGE